MIVHLIKLINAHNAPVRKHHCSRLQVPLTCVLVGDASSSQTDAGGTPTSGVDGKGSDAHDLAKELGLGSRRVAHHQDVDVTPQVRLRVQTLLDSAQ